MNICEEGHAEIVYDGLACPLCDAMEDHESERQEYQKNINVLEEQVEVLNSEVDRLMELED